MIFLLLLIFLVLIIFIIYNQITLLQYEQKDYLPPIAIFDTSQIPLIDPPSEIIIEGNPYECHKQLTPCTTHQDCDICREGLANCQYFDEKTIVTLINDNNEEEKLTILPGESYCLALDRERARSCNPNTGVWLLAESPVGFSLLCSCLTPGLVTQLSLYDDCNIPIGCQPHGQIISINETPMRCSCDLGFVADFDVTTQTPYCRSRRIRDVIQNPEFFPLAPCPAGFVRIEDENLDPEYLRMTNARNVCVIDPCSVDPVSGVNTHGRLSTYVYNDERIAYCHCPAIHLSFGVYSEQSMLKRGSVRTVNACIKPVNFINFDHHSRYSYFWGDDDKEHFSNDNIRLTFSSYLSLSSLRYFRMVYTYENYLYVKFSPSYTPNIGDTSSNQNNTFFEFLRYNQGSSPCISYRNLGCHMAAVNSCLTSQITIFNVYCRVLLSRNNNQIIALQSPLNDPIYPAVLNVSLYYFFLVDHPMLRNGELFRGRDLQTSEHNITTVLPAILHIYPKYNG
ncbi:PIF-1 [Spodoptera exempta nucleopolyhedrovirus]|uniref:PIF-1 n=1 Tax=Spodoptera exempta nucleopolyhedrovirus TaxID=1242863 RepID=A0A410S7P2_9ABAC|nr:PIF-1 [Spodoptera exempta nucleopolyhedrovirus]QAT90319.1 PIF-1 [Spodoptera exempta nucleopolyhedrovirus]